MTIKQGDALPEVSMVQMSAEGPEAVALADKHSVRPKTVCQVTGRTLWVGRSNRLTAASELVFHPTTFDEVSAVHSPSTADFD